MYKEFPALLPWWQGRFNRGYWSFMLTDHGWVLGTLACTSQHILCPTWTTEGCPRGSGHVSKITDIFTCKTAAETNLTSTLSDCHLESHRFGTKLGHFGIPKGIPRLMDARAAHGISLSLSCSHSFVLSWDFGTILCDYKYQYVTADWLSQAVPTNTSIPCFVYFFILSHHSRKGVS